jgi:hypothetical protein
MSPPRSASAEFTDNGGYCDPGLLDAFMPAEPEGEFEEGAMMEDAIPGPVTGSPDDGCFEREVGTYDDGSVEEYEFAIDVDDGFDIDEAGPGSMFVTVTGSVMDGNLDEGFDFDEEDAGDITATYIDTTASGNTDDGYKHSEEGEGGVFGLVSERPRPRTMEAWVSSSRKRTAGYVGCRRARQRHLGQR